jgi:hypothetical protein
LSECFQSLITAVRGSQVIPSQQRERIRDVADPGPRPSLDFSVARLRQDYADFVELANAFVAAARPDRSVDEAVELGDEARGALAALDGETRERIPGLPEFDLPRQLDKRLAQAVRSYVARLVERFRDDALDLSAAAETLAGLGSAFAGWNVECAKRVDELARDVDAALGIRARFAPAPPSGGLEQRIDAFVSAVELVDKIRLDAVVADADVIAWREAWSDGQVRQLFKAIKNELEVVPQDLRSTVVRLEQPAARIKEFVPEVGNELEALVLAVLAKIDGGAAPKKPAAWSDEAWRLWPQRYRVPNGLEAEAREGRLVCSFPFRRRVVDVGVEERSRVEMLLVTPAVEDPFLVDRHEVCVGEMLALGVSRINDPGDYVLTRDRHWARIQDVPTALLSWTSQDMARTFAQRAYAAVGLELPTRAQWAALLPPGAPDLDRRETADPRAVLIVADDDLRGVFGLRSGVAEWLADREGDSVAGVTDYERASLEGVVPWKKGVGFRGVLTLDPLD